MAEDSDAQNNAKKILDLGWRQGSVVSDELSQRLRTQDDFPQIANALSGVLIVVSQDCDLCNDSYEKEPWVELLLAGPVEEPNGLLLNGNHPRVIQFEIVNGEHRRHYESSVHNKFRIDRRELSNNFPLSYLSLSQGAIRDIKHWLARRYVREGFPNEFERRISRSKSKLTNKIFKLPAKGGLFTAIFLLLSEDELPENETYKVIMWLTMTPDDYSSQRNIAEEIAGQIADILNSCEGIEVVDHQVKSEADVSLAERSQLKRWDYDALSFAHDLPTIVDS